MMSSRLNGLIENVQYLMRKVPTLGASIDLLDGSSQFSSCSFACLPCLP